MRQIKINTTSGVELLTTQNVKDYVRIDTTADDTLIGEMISQARIWCENYISRDIVAKNRTYYLEKTNGVFDLPFGPVASISQLTINGTTTQQCNNEMDSSSERSLHQVCMAQGFDIKRSKVSGSRINSFIQ